MNNKRNTNTPHNKKYPVMKPVLDLILIVVLGALDGTHVISLMYYELVGLSLFGCILIHLLLNGKWITNIAEGAFAGNGKAIALAIVDLLTIFAWIAVLDTGILSSAVLYAFPIEWLRPWHSVSVAIALILTGIYYGVHRFYPNAAVCSTCQKIL